MQPQAECQTARLRDATQAGPPHPVVRPHSTAATPGPGGPPLTSSLPVTVSIIPASISTPIFMPYFNTGFTPYPGGSCVLTSSLSVQPVIILPL